MSYYFRERPRFGERFRGKSGDELLEELKQQFAEGGPFFDAPEGPRATAANGNGAGRDPFERHTSFPRGFPFEEEGFGRRSDIRSHLDDLAARHPEFAEHLLGPPWGDIPFPGGGSLHRERQRRDSDRGQGQQHNQPDEDARSQASGSSAASGASGVSSRGSEPEEPQHGMENPLGTQHQRNVRSMSAPPENRNAGDGLLNNPRFVSRVDIAPNSQQQQQREKSPAPQKQPQGQQQQQPQSQQQVPRHESAGNVRHIPIFVEGRDEPVLPKTHDETDFPKRQQSPPHLHRPSHYQQFYNKHPPGWSSHFQDPFFEQPNDRWAQPPPPPTQPTYRHTQHQEDPRDAQQNQRHKPQSQAHPQFQHRQPRRHEMHQEDPRETLFTESQQNQRHKPQTQAHPQSQHRQTQPQAQPQSHQPQNEAQAEAPAKPKQQIQPKDPLEKVALVQQEVDALTEQVKLYTGNSRQDKQYMFLDEMLTRELIKLDDIETEGKENVRQARKEAIKSIQESISLLESKAPLPGQQSNVDVSGSYCEAPQSQSQDKSAESMETSEEAVPEEQKAIPLPPPCPSSPTKAAPEVTKEEAAPINAEANDNIVDNIQNIKNETSLQNGSKAQEEAGLPQNTSNVEEIQKLSESQTAEPMESSPTIDPSDLPIEMQQPSPVKEIPSGVEQLESQTLINNEQNQEIKDAPEIPIVPTAETTSAPDEKPKKEPPPVPQKPGKSPKKAKKAKKQPEPVSVTAIPLPAPGQTI